MSLIFSGNSDATLVGAPQWGGGGFDLDTLTLNYSVGSNKLDAFFNTFTKWKPSPIDANMFLDGNPSVDSSKTYPNVSVRYIGCRRGQLPPGKNDAGQTVQSASSSKRSTVAGFAGSSAFTVELVYYAPTASYTWISTSPATGGSAPALLFGIRIISFRVNGGNIPADLVGRAISAYFELQAITTHSYEEIVPGLYFRNTTTMTQQYITASLSL